MGYDYPLHILARNDADRRTQVDSLQTGLQHSPVKQVGLACGVGPLLLPCSRRNTSLDRVGEKEKLGCRAY